VKWAVLLCSIVVTWVANSVYLLLFTMVLHSWWAFIPTMGWHTATILSGLIVIAILVGRFIGGFTAEIIKGLK